MSLRIDPRKRVKILINHAIEISGIPICPVDQGDGTNFCWAACVKMILKTYFPALRDELCAIANRAVLIQLPGSTSDCCGAGSPTCRKPVSDCVITQVWGEFRIPISYVTPPPANLAQRLLALLRQNHPVELAYEAGEIGHVVMLYGWAGDTTGDRFTFYYQDPADRAKYHVRADRIGDNGEENRLRAFWEIRIDDQPNPHCDEKVKIRSHP
jgi:Papain-like cysteine protease AvrRpt2